MKSESITDTKTVFCVIIGQINLYKKPFLSSILPSGTIRESLYFKINFPDCKLGISLSATPLLKEHWIEKGEKLCSRPVSATA